MAPFGDSIPNGMEWNEMEKVSGDTGSGKTPRWYGWRTYRRTDGRTDVVLPWSGCLTPPLIAEVISWRGRPDNEVET